MKAREEALTFLIVSPSVRPTHDRERIPNRSQCPKHGGLTGAVWAYDEVEVRIEAFNREVAQTHEVARLDCVQAHVAGSPSVDVLLSHLTPHGRRNAESEGTTRSPHSRKCSARR